MAQFVSMSKTPSFSSVTLTEGDADFDPDNIRSGYMTKEEQLQQLYQRIIALEKKRDECCRDILFWEAHVQIVRMNKNTIFGDGSTQQNYNILTAGGVVSSSFNDNVNIGILRRGLPYTVTFPVKWDSEIYTARNVHGESNSSCAKETTSYEIGRARTTVQYRIVEDDWLNVCNCVSGAYKNFWYPSSSSESSRKTVAGQIINYDKNWGSFIHATAADGTVSITDNRGYTDFNVIRYYTQWILRECADGSLFTDPDW